MVADRSSPSRVRFAASRPGLLRADPRGDAVHEGKGGGWAWLSGCYPGRLVWLYCRVMEHQFGELRERMAHLEGLLEGLREAITGRASAS